MSETRPVGSPGETTVANPPNLRSAHSNRGVGGAAPPQQSYDPAAFWGAAGADPTNSEHESNFVRTEVFARQEERLMALLRNLDFRSILEVGCGWGRITKLVHDEWPLRRYMAIDLSADRIASARRKVNTTYLDEVDGVDFAQSTVQDFDANGSQFDLVLAVETLMHVPPAEIEEVVTKLFALSARYVVSLDWAADLGDKPIADHNFRHDYAALYGSRLRSVEQVGLQALYVAEEEFKPKGSLKPAKAKPKGSLKS